mgnify:CR=1 FL=1
MEDNGTLCMVVEGKEAVGGGLEQRGAKEDANAGMVVDVYLDCLLASVVDFNDYCFVDGIFLAKDFYPVARGEDGGHGD